MPRQEFVPGDEYVPPSEEYIPPSQGPGGVYPGEPLPEPEPGEPTGEFDDGLEHVIVGNLDNRKLERISENYGIPHWQYNKVRKILQKIYMSEGYPVRFNHYIGYYSGMGFWVPTWHVVDVTSTNMDWKSFGVDRMMLGVEHFYRQEWEGQVVFTLPMNEKALPWRSVRIKPIPNETMQGFLDFIPTFMDSAIIGAIGSAIGHVIPLFPNLGFYNTINNKLIDYNWDTILEVLNQNGY